MKNKESTRYFSDMHERSVCKVLNGKQTSAYKNSVGVKNSPRFKGKKHTEETKKKISESLRKHYEK